MNKECLNDRIQNLDYISRTVHQKLENNLLKMSLTKVTEEVSRNSKNLISDHNMMRKNG